jgi:GT2 family glycosyltransferase
MPGSTHTVEAFVSVVVLNHNGASVISRCIECLLTQSYTNFEIIVVDNNSTDSSLSILQNYFNAGRIMLVRSNRNYGVPGGRNLGLSHARGEIVAFIDNDGYARDNWLTEGVKTLLSDPRLGAVAPLVFFADNTLILNGAGGTLNLQGYGGDICFNTPFEFATIPGEVLYPMGCGMIFRRAALDRIGPFDSSLFNYYDDVDAGIRTWKAGYKVIVARDSQVDHGFSYTERIFKNKVLLCERNRLRVILKHFGAAYILSWLAREIPYSMRYFLTPSLRSIPIRAWAWNFLHLASIVRWRARFPSDPRAFAHLIDATWGTYPLPTANNQAFRPAIQDAVDTLVIDGHTELPQLQFGWYNVERDGALDFRWTEEYASALFVITLATKVMTLRLRTESVTDLVVWLKSFKDPKMDSSIVISQVSREWSERTFGIDLQPGAYRMVLSAKTVHIDASRRRLGVAIADIRFNLS